MDEVGKSGKIAASQGRPMLKLSFSGAFVALCSWELLLHLVAGAVRELSVCRTRT